MSRRGVVWTTIILLVLLLLSFISLAGWIYQMKKGIADGGEIEACRLSVIAASQSKMIMDPLIAVDCPRIERVVHKDQVTVKNQLKTDLISRAVADELKDCWYKMGQGSLDGFNTNIIGGFGSDDYACLICSSLRFDGEVQELVRAKTGGYIIDGFKQFLETELMSPASPYPYGDYLTIDRSVSVSALPLELNEVSGMEGLAIMDSIDVSKKYHIFYIVHHSTLLRTGLITVRDIFDLSPELISEKNFWAGIYVADQTSIHNLKCGGGVLN